MNEFKKNWKVYVLLTLGVLIGVSTIGYALINHLYGRFVTDRVEVTGSLIADAGDTNDKEEPIPKAFADENLNIFLMATDESGFRTDSMMVIHYDQVTKTTSLFSIPRDYRVEVSEELKDLIHYKRDFIKFTEFHAYAKNAKYESPASLTTQVVEQLLNIEIDHMVVIDIEGFKKVVDAVGGVEVNVPQRLYYKDPTQDLVIDLQPGLQTLYGEQAEGFVRFRQTNDHKGYGDFGRMEMQQYFLKSFVKKFFSASSLMNVGEIYTSLGEFVTTDATLEDAIGILKIVKDADLKRVYSHTLPGVNEKIDGIYYYNPPERFELLSLIRDTIAHDKAPLQDSKLIPIKVLNGTSTKGLAESVSETLTAAGYSVLETGTYKGERSMRTKIYVPREGLGQDLTGYFELAEVIVDPERFKAEDPEHIIIALGSIHNE